MSRSQDPPDAEREQTDESLRAEREVTDQVLGDEHDGIDELADAVITRARLRADEVLAAARARNDRMVGHDASPLVLTEVISSERADEDRLLRKERADADKVLGAERAHQTALLAAERTETDNDLSRERKRADDALAVRDEFLGIVSHDLRNMLNLVVLSAGLIEANVDGERADYVVKHAQRIRRSGARMSRLVGDLVDVASIEAGALAVTCEDADLTAVVAEAVETFQPQAAGSDISLEAALAPRLVGSFDPARILQVLGNLLSNALKFTPSGGKVRVVAEREGAELSLCVVDTGGGIPGDKLEVVFERALRLNQSDRRGLGLGLYISKCIVQGHGGRIWAESEFGKGTKICITLPDPRVAP